MKRKPRRKPDYLGVGTVITTSEGTEIIICAANLDALKSYLSEDVGHPEARKVALFLGPFVELPSIS